MSLFPLLSRFFRMYGIFMTLFIPFVLSLLCFFGLRGTKRDMRPPHYPMLITYNYSMPHYFVWAGNCNLININVLLLFLPRGVHTAQWVWSVTPELFLVDRYFFGIKPADCTTLPKKYQHTCLKSKGRHGPGRGLNPWCPADNVHHPMPIMYIIQCR